RSGVRARVSRIDDRSKAARRRRTAAGSLTRLMFSIGRMWRLVAVWRGCTDGLPHHSVRQHGASRVRSVSAVRTELGMSDQLDGFIVAKLRMRGPMTLQQIETRIIRDKVVPSAVALRALEAALIRLRDAGTIRLEGRKWRLLKEAK